MTLASSPLYFRTNSAAKLSDDNQWIDIPPLCASARIEGGVVVWVGSGGDSLVEAIGAVKCRGVGVGVSPASSWLGLSGRLSRRLAVVSDSGVA
ncbi:hypothetical protein Droror1_Dr00015463 [Drosera rotundifolia]